MPFSSGPDRAGGDSVRVRRATLEIPLSNGTSLSQSPGPGPQPPLGRLQLKGLWVLGLVASRSSASMLWCEESKQALAT